MLDLADSPERSLPLAVTAAVRCRDQVAITLVFLSVRPFQHRDSFFKLLDPFID